MNREDTLIWGRRPVIEALRENQVREVLLAEGLEQGGVVREIHDLAVQHGARLRTVPAPQLERLAGERGVQGVAAYLKPPRELALPELLGRGSPAFLLVLDQVQDPQNLGALLRSADAAGVHGVVLPDRRSAPLSGAAFKASAGAAARVPHTRVTNLARALDDIRKAGVWTVGLDSGARDSIYAVDLRVPVALVFGSEGSGLRRLTRERCDFLASIPMRGAVASLNVSAAGAVALYEVVRQRRDASVQ